ncbi:MAG: hypothetical protein JXR76_10980 [Deltaproteobacteria bacterium]|nr:hypothetical protein [Deltaproteobacteria bacterium]
MTKLKLVTSDKKSGAEQAPQSKEALVEQSADIRKKQSTKKLSQFA